MNQHPYPTSCDPLGLPWWEQLPEHLQPGLALYFDAHVETGGFLRAVLENDLGAAVVRADFTLTMGQLRALMTFLLVGGDWRNTGSPERVAAWLAKRGE
jgi:hypothetical protein